MKLHHRNPCHQCPWRKASPAGWLGGHSPAFYADAVIANEVPACHLRDEGPDCDETAMCVGALSVIANSASTAWRTVGGEEARQIIGKRDDTFGHPAQFYEYHAQKPWVHPFLREKAA